MNILFEDHLIRADDCEVRVMGDEPVIVNKEYGPLVFTQVRVTASNKTCEWIIERQWIGTDEWIEVARFPGQVDEEFTA